MESVYLNGSEQVQRAGTAMLSAADSMRQTYAWMEERMLQHQRFLDEWLARYEAMLAERKP